MDRGAWQISWTEEPGGSHGQRSLTGYSPKSLKELDMTNHAHMQGKRTKVHVEPRLLG